MTGLARSSSVPLHELDSLARDHGDAFGAPPPRPAPVETWRKALADPRGPFLEHLRACYGPHGELLDRRRALWLSVLERFALAFDDRREVFLLAVPSRINWEGHHVDHQGGSYNATTDEREIVAVVRPRLDRSVHVVNVAHQRFGDAAFSLDDDGKKGTRSEWDSYLRGAALALQKRLAGTALRGMDMAVGSDIPIGAGLSSSHALVLAGALGVLAVNRAQLDKRQAVMLVQEGEWFVGSRTGLGDQASMVFGKRDRIFSSPVIEPDEIAPRYVVLPPQHVRVLVNSFTQHKLAGASGLGYNARVFAYKAAFPLVLSALCDVGAAPGAIRACRRLAHVAPDRFPVAFIYRALASLPDRMTLAEAEELFGRALGRIRGLDVPPPGAGFADLVGTYFGDGDRPEAISVKGVALYGLAECWRSRRYPELLEQGQLEPAGRLVYVGHDGDRVVRRDGHGRYLPSEPTVTNARLLALAADAESADPARVEAAQLEWQPGDYRASVPELDRIVDVCRDAGAVSASLTGGGLGGVVTAMIRSDRLSELEARVLDLFAVEEEHELRELEAASAGGAIPAGAVDAARTLRASKRAAWAAERAFQADPSLVSALAPARFLQSGSGEMVVRLLPIDYRREGFVENGSIAGAGYLSPPGA